MTSSRSRHRRQLVLPLLAVFVLVAWLSPVAAQADDSLPAAVFLVRHAEKKKETDPRLTEAGQHRAAELTRVLGDANLDAIYATQWRRTIATAAPIAAATGLAIRKVSIDGGDYAQRMAHTLLTEHGGEVVLVVGHSDTTPQVVEALGVAQVPAIPDHQYDDLFLVVFDGAKPRLIALDYGSPTP